MMLVKKIYQKMKNKERPALLSTRHLSYIYLGSSVCHPVCHPVIFLSSCHSCGTLSYSLCFSNQTDQGDDMEGLEREGLEIKR
jgi:hypothetical protein